jgi:pyruvate ferredoxin oxidoreductase gamma subunit
VKEIRVHGRGGQGAVLAARMLATFFVMRGNYVASFPMYGFERRGAPVVAFTRVDDEPIKEKMQIYSPDCLLVIDPGLISLQGLFTGLKSEGVLVLNSPDGLKERPNPNLHLLGYIDAANIALEEIGRDVPNTCLLGALARTTGWLDMDSIAKGLHEYFDGNLLEVNINSAKRGFEEVKIKKW